MNHIKTIRIFVSSTFKDMDLERDALRNIVAPRLNQELALYNINVEMVDLRHTVETNPHLSKTEREQRVFNICMDEIESCSPYFIALVGHRYGWIPDINKIVDPNKTKTIRRNDFPLKDDEISVTSYEFLKGLFENGTKNKHSLVYVRNEKSYETLFETEKKVYADSDKDDNRRISDLRKYLIENFVTNKETYILDPTGNNKAQLNHWCDCVFSDILNLMEVEKNKTKKNTPQQAAHQLFIQNHLRNFMGRDDEISKCMRHVNNHEVCNIISIKDGVGKSSLLCKLYEIISSEKKWNCIFVSNQAVEETDSTQELNYLCEQMALNLDMSDDELSSFLREEDPFRTIEKLKERAQKKGITFCIFWDNFNEQLETLNYETMEFMRPIVTTPKLSPSGYKRVSENNFLHYTYIDEFKENDVKNILAGKRKSFVESILKKDKVGNPQWLSLAVIIYDNLNKADYIKIRSANNLDAEKNIDAYITDMVKEMPNDISDLSLFWINKLFVIFGKDFCCDYLCTLSLIEIGLKDKDISKIINQPEDWCIYFRQMAGSQIVEKTEKGTWKLKSEPRLALLKSFSTPTIEKAAKRANKYLKSNSLPYLTRAHRFILSSLSNDIPSCQEYLIQIGHAANNWFKGLIPSDLADIDIAKWLKHNSSLIDNCLGQLARSTNLSYDFVSGIECLLARAAHDGQQKEYLKISSILLEELRKKEISGKIDVEHNLIKAYIYSKRASILYAIEEHYEAYNQIQLGLMICKDYIEDTKDWLHVYFDLVTMKANSLDTPNKKLSFIKEHFVPICFGKKFFPSYKDVESVISFCNIASYSSLLYQEEGNMEMARDLLQNAIKINKESIEFTDNNTSFLSLWQARIFRDTLMDLMWYICKLQLETECFNHDTVINQVRYALTITEKNQQYVKDDPVLHVKNYAIRAMFVILIGKSSKEQAIKEIQTGMIFLININDPFGGTAPADEDAMYDISVAWMLFSRLFLMNIYNEEKIDDVPNYGLFGDYLCPSDIVSICINILQKHFNQNLDNLMLDIRYVYMYVLYLFLKIEEKKGFFHAKDCSACLEEFNRYSQKCRNISMRFKSMEDDIKNIETKLKNNITQENSNESEVSSIHDDFESSIVEALNNGDLSSAEHDSEQLLKQVLSEYDPDTIILGKAYYLSGIVQLKKKIWFKAYDRLEKSVKAYEHNTDMVAPVLVYKNLAEAYIKSHNEMEAKTILNRAIKKYQIAGKSENYYFALCELLNNIETEEKMNHEEIDEVDTIVEDAHSQTFWDIIKSLFR